MIQTNSYANHFYILLTILVDTVQSTNAGRHGKNRAGIIEYRLGNMSSRHTDSPVRITFEVNHLVGCVHNCLMNGFEIIIGLFSRFHDGESADANGRPDGDRRVPVFADNILGMENEYRYCNKLQ